MTTTVLTTTVSSTTVPSTTVPSTTVPSTTVPSTTVPSTRRTAAGTAASAPLVSNPDRAVLVVPDAATKGWHADPMAIHKLRWHDGTEWTGHVTHFGPVPCQHCGS